jgi:hypothetical protein
MKDITPTNLSFSSWATQTYTQEKEILELMLKSDSTLDRTIATDIIKAAGGKENA